MRNLLLLLLTMALLGACNSKSDYHSTAGRTEADIWQGGVQMIPVETPKGTFKVWTKRVGNNPKIKVLLLHGGPGATHEYFEIFDSYLPQEGIEYYYYDQLGSSYSDNPNDPELWNIPQFVEEVETVRKALGLNKDNFYLLGHSWGGILAIEYALKYQENLKGMIVSNMVPSIPDYMDYANNVLGPQLPAEVLKTIREYEAAGDFTNPAYLSIVEEYYYPEHILRKPLNEWPEPVNRSFAKTNYPLYLKMQGPSEFGVVGDAILKDWDRKADIGSIQVPLLSIAGQYDTMDPAAMKELAELAPKGDYLLCPNSGHMAMYDDPEIYFKGLIQFLK